MAEFDCADWTDGVVIHEPWFEEGLDRTCENELPGLWVGNMDGLEEIDTLELVNFHDRDDLHSAVVMERDHVPTLVEALEAWYESSE
ncbi:hypothetical protein [Halobacterium wangiae]|uniref:hypothetical protein n=1 Tax=Halobacterium wangiae TaxID=2902623 RepID=UPI001E618FEF|nr:hypothetical protein [Halobacterium wangiae]